MGLRSNRSPRSTLPNNLSKNGLLIIQSRRFAPSARATNGGEEKVADGARGLARRGRRGARYGRMFIRVRPVKYARGINNAVTMYNRVHRDWLCPAVTGKQARKDQFETIKLHVSRRSCFVGYRGHYCYLVKLLIRSLLAASEWRCAYGLPRRTGNRAALTVAVCVCMCVCVAVI